MAIKTYGDLLASRRHYLHQPGGEAIGGISQTTPDGWRSFADCSKDARRQPGRGGLGVAFVHGGLGVDGGSVCFFDADYKPLASDGDTPAKREWFAATLGDFRSMFEPSDGSLAISRSGAGRHLVGVTEDEDREDFASAFKILGKKAEVSCPLDVFMDADGRETCGVKIEFWDWVGGSARSRFLTGKWRGGEPSPETPLPALSFAAFRSNPHIAALIETAQTPSAPQDGGSRGSRPFRAMIQPYLEAGGAAVLGALLAKGLRGNLERGGMRFRGEEIGCHTQSGGNAGSVQIGWEGDALAHCHSGCSQERLWAAIHGHLGWLPTGQKACRFCESPHSSRFDACLGCKPQTRQPYGGGFRQVLVRPAAYIAAKAAAELSLIETRSGTARERTFLVDSEMGEESYADHYKREQEKRAAVSGHASARAENGGLAARRDATDGGSVGESQEKGASGGGAAGKSGADATAANDGGQRGHGANLPDESGASADGAASEAIAVAVAPAIGDGEGYCVAHNRLHLISAGCYACAKATG